MCLELRQPEAVCYSSVTRSRDVVASKHIIKAMQLIRGITDNEKRYNYMFEKNLVLMQ